jgi:hypothetical protein
MSRTRWSPPGTFQLSIDGNAVAGFTADPALGGLLSAPLPAAFTANLIGTHTLTIDQAGNLAPASPQPGDTSAIDPDKLPDIVLYLEYRFA